MRGVRRVVILVGALTMLAIAVAVPAQAGPESTFVSRINGSRAAAGLPPLQVDPDLVDDARAWSQHMMEAGAISHNPNLASVTTGWDTLGENVGVGPDEGTLHDAFMASAGHRANILGDYTDVGVGVVVENDTRMWVTVVFMKGIGAPPPATTTTTSTTVATIETTTAETIETTTTAAGSDGVQPGAPAAPGHVATPSRGRPSAAERPAVVVLGRPPAILPTAV